MYTTRVISLLSLALVGLGVLATGAASGGSTASSQATLLDPPSKIFTCGWIKAHPTDATVHGVSCRKDMVNPGTDPQRAAVLRAQLGQPKPRSVRVRSARNGPHTQFVPLSVSGHIQDWDWLPGPTDDYFMSPGVYASTFYTNAVSRYGSPGSASQTFHWYIEKSSGYIAHNSSVNGWSYPPIPQFPTTRTKIRNDGSSVQNFQAYWQYGHG